MNLKISKDTVKRSADLLHALSSLRCEVNGNTDWSQSNWSSVEVHWTLLSFSTKIGYMREKYQKYVLIDTDGYVGEERTNSYSWF